jgi:hypothetical protein
MEKQKRREYETAVSSGSPTKWSPDPHETKEIHPRKFDQQTLNQLTGTQLRLLEAIQYDARCTAKHSPTGAKYSVKPQAYFAKLLGVCRESISDAVQGLSKLGILEVTYRRKLKGMWQTNLMKIRSWVWWRFAKAIQTLRRAPHRVTQTSHISIPMRETINQEEKTSGFAAGLTAQILERWRSRSPNGNATT